MRDGLQYFQSLLEDHVVTFKQVVGFEPLVGQHGRVPPLVVCPHAVQRVQINECAVQFFSQCANRFAMNNKGVWGQSQMTSAERGEGAAQILTY